MIASSITRPLPPTVADRLIKIAGLLGSGHSGEAANAASAATKLLRDHGMTWEQVVRSGVVVPPPTRPHHHHGPIDWRAAASACLQRPGLFSRWEHDFLDSVLGFRRLSLKQEAILGRLIERVRAAGGAP